MKKLLIILLLMLPVAAGAQLLDDLALKYLAQQPAHMTGQTPVIILLHGYGSDERDLFELKSALPANFLVISARAPYPAGNGGYQWFEIGAVSGSKTEQMETSRQLIHKFIGQVRRKYHTCDRIFLAGFSQGAMMSYATGLRYPESVAGIGVLSGKLFPSLKNEIKVNALLKKLKIFIAHGTADDRISFADGKAANDYLASIGLRPAFHTYNGMGHSISREELNDLVHWLQ